MKPSHDSSDDYKFPETANETLSEKNTIFMCFLLRPVIGTESPQTQSKQIFFFYLFFHFVVLCHDNSVIIFAVGLHLSM